MSDSPNYEVPESVDNPLWHLIRRYARPHAARYLVAAVGTALAQVPQRVPALVVGVALDAILLSSATYSLPLVPGGLIPDTTGGQVTFTVALLVAAFALDGVLSWSAGRLAATARLRTLHDIRADTFESVVGHELPFFDDRRTGDVVGERVDDAAVSDYLPGDRGVLLDEFEATPGEAVLGFLHLDAEVLRVRHRIEDRVDCHAHPLRGIGHTVLPTTRNVSSVCRGRAGTPHELVVW